MIAPFDVFKQEDNGEVLWLAATETLEQAHDQIATALARSPGSSFIIVNQKTGERQVVPSSATPAS